MVKDMRLWIALAGFGVAAWLLVPQVLGPRAPTVRVEDRTVADYICRETQEVFRLPATGPVLANPRTGKATLVPAVYDSRSKAWKPGLPPDTRQALRTRRR
jgi:hypothetical protein